MDDEVVIANRVAARFDVPRWLESYIRGKVAWDPAYKAVFEVVKNQEGPVVDVGCGLGLLAFSLRERGHMGTVTGYDPDEQKIQRAQSAASGLDGLTFKVGDANDVRDWGEVVVILDVLHYLDDEAQEVLLGRIADSLPPGGVVLIRNGIRDRSLRYFLTYAEEIWVRASRWIGVGGALNFPTCDEVIRPFQRRGWTVDVRPLWGRTPFNSYLFTMRKPR